MAEKLRSLGKAEQQTVRLLIRPENVGIMAVAFYSYDFLGVEYTDLLADIHHHGIRFSFIDPHTYTCEGLYHIGLAAGLHQIINRLYLEGVNGVIETRGNENDLSFGR